jgi:subtilisin-like proprotein convertase family protein
MRKLTLLSAVFLLGILLSQVGYANGTYKYTSKPHLPVLSAQTTMDAIHVPVNVPIADVRVGLYIKAVMYSTLRITLSSPFGTQVVLKAESGNIATVPLYGSLGAPGSLVLFQQGGDGLGPQPNNRPINPSTPLVTLNGEMSAGWWTLRVIDERNPNAWIPQEGFLEEWQLLFNRQIIEPVQPFTPPVNILWPGGANLFGQINGTSASATNPHRAQIPNETNGLLLCNPPPADPNVVMGRNGDAFPVIITGHPGALIGTAANGYPAGRFRITITVETNWFPNSPFLSGLTEDIAIYFGKVPDAQYSPPLPPPPASGDPGFQAKNPSGWPTGAGTVNSLLGGASGLWGGVRLANCLSPQPGVDVDGFDRVTFDDLALEMIDNNLPVGPAGGFSGTYRPQQQLSTLNGLPVDGLYYVSVYDCFGDNPAGYGHIRVTYLQVEYIVGGGEISDPVRHQGFIKSLLGVPIPGTFAGTTLGYLSDIVGPIPPYREHAKDQDPLLVFWATQKMYPKDATGTERIMAVDRHSNSPSSATAYHGPYAYPGSLDSNPLQAGVLVNADVLNIPNGDYHLRVNIIHPRYDDDLSDNEYTGAEMRINPISISYHGEQLTQWNKWIDPARMTLTAAAGITPGTGVAQSFTLFKFPTNRVASVDYKFDGGTPLNPRAAARISVWRVSGITGYTGAPSTLVARSTTVGINSYVGLGNWRTFALYPVDAQGNPDINAGGGVDLAPGTYVFVLDNVDGAAQFLVYPYTYGIMPAMKDRYWDYLFGDNFGPLGPFNTLGTRMGYYSGTNTNPPTFAWGATTGRSLANHCLPMRVNMTNLNDFGVNYVRFSSQNSPTEDIIIGQPNTPTVNVSSFSSQGGNRKDFNIYLGIYDQGDNLIHSDQVNIANAPYFGIEGYQTLTINMSPWTPQTGGWHKIKAFFTRNPDDQNPVNDRIEYDLFIQTQPIVAYDDDVDGKLLNDAIDDIRKIGAEPTLVNLSQSNLKAFDQSTIYFVGTMNNDVKAHLTDAIARGNDVAMVYDLNAHLGATIRNIDMLFDIERAAPVNYETVELMPTISAIGESDEGVQGVELPEFTTKEDLLRYITSQELKPAAPENNSLSKPGDNSAFDNALPVAVSSKFGHIRYLSNERSKIGIIHTMPANRQAGSVVTEDVLPAAFVLGQNYPNPFNPVTAISYTLPEASTVTLRVLDLLGREVALLVNEAQNAGSYTVSFKGLDKNGRDLTSGTYLYRLEAIPSNGGTVFSSTKKMLLSK